MHQLTIFHKALHQIYNNQSICYLEKKDCEIKFYFKLEFGEKMKVIYLNLYQILVIFLIQLFYLI